jgi:hypothetical protein
MIRFKCPSCQKAMGVDDSKAGALGMCPGCRATFRIPAPATVPPPVQAPTPAPPPVVPMRPYPDPAPPVMPTYQDDANTYAVQLDAAAAVPVRKKLPSIADEYEPTEEELDERIPAQRRRGRRNMGFTGDLIPGLSNFALIMIVLGLGWVCTGGLTFFVPVAGLLMIGVGSLISFVAGIWLIKIAFDDGVGTGLAVVFVPFYGLMFIFSNLDRTGVPFLINLVGQGYIITAIISILTHGPH